MKKAEKEDTEDEEDDEDDENDKDDQVIARIKWWRQPECFVTN